MDGDITAEQLLELLADDEMIESGYDREGMVALLLLARAALQVQSQELADVRAAPTATYELRGVWPDGDEQPDVMPDRIVFVDEDGERADFFVVDCRPLLNGVIDRAEARAFTGPLSVWANWVEGAELPRDVGLSDPDGDPIDVELSATGLIEEVRRRQAKAVIRRHELSDPLGPELGAVLALVPSPRWLAVDPLANGRRVAWWRDEENQLLAHASGDTYEAAILAATGKLLGHEGSLRRRVAGSPDAVVRAAKAYVDSLEHDDLAPWTDEERALIDAVEQLRGASPEEERQTCGSCAHWCRDGDPATKGGARPCWLDKDAYPTPRHPACPCGLPGRYEPLAEAEADTDPAPESPPLRVRRPPDPLPLPGVSIPRSNMVRSEGGDDG